MSALTITYALAVYLSVATCVLGVAYRVWRYLRTPMRFPIPTTPAPTGAWGVVARVLREAVLFESLFKATRWTWAFGWLFHLTLLAVLLGHLRFFTEPWWRTWPDTEGLKQPVGFVMVIALAALGIRRLLVERIRYISTPADHAMLLLLIGIGVSGLWLGSAPRPDIEAVRLFIVGLTRLDWRPLPAHPAVLCHLTLVVALLAVFPFSKLLHAPGVFLTPTRAHPDNARERRLA